MTIPTRQQVAKHVPILIMKGLTSESLGTKLLCSSAATNAVQAKRTIVVTGFGTTAVTQLCGHCGHSKHQTAYTNWQMDMQDQLAKQAAADGILCAKRKMPSILEE